MTTRGINRVLAAFKDPVYSRVIENYGTFMLSCETPGAYCITIIPAGSRDFHQVERLSFTIEAEAQVSSMTPVTPRLFFWKTRNGHETSSLFLQCSTHANHMVVREEECPYYEYLEDYMKRVRQDDNIFKEYFTITCKDDYAIPVDKSLFAEFCGNLRAEIESPGTHTVNLDKSYLCIFSLVRLISNMEIENYASSNLELICLAYELESENLMLRVAEVVDDHDIQVEYALSGWKNVRKHEPYGGRFTAMYAEVIKTEIAQLDAETWVKLLDDSGMTKEDTQMLMWETLQKKQKLIK